MATDDDDALTEDRSPEAAFSLVSNETRFEILRALQAADEPLARARSA